ncbi:MAG: hypothetical protein SPL30_08465 [Succinivibrio sp.]|jgi:hypothetical protein|nr:hypothetical protein [Succinivibrio sp.]
MGKWKKRRHTAGTVLSESKNPNKNKNLLGFLALSKVFEKKFLQETAGAALMLPQEGEDPEEREFLLESAHDYKSILDKMQSPAGVDLLRVCREFYLLTRGYLVNEPYHNEFDQKAADIRKSYMAENPDSQYTKIPAAQADDLIQAWSQSLLRISRNFQCLNS